QWGAAADVEMDRFAVVSFVAVALGGGDERVAAVAKAVLGADREGPDPLTDDVGERIAVTVDRHPQARDRGGRADAEAERLEAVRGKFAHREEAPGMAESGERDGGDTARLA